MAFLEINKSWKQLREIKIVLLCKLLQNADHNFVYIMSDQSKYTVLNKF